MVHRILEAHANVKNLTNMESKLSFIRAWQALPEYGISLFVVKFVGSKKEVGLLSNMIRLWFNVRDNVRACVWSLCFLQIHH